MTSVLRPMLATPAGPEGPPLGPDWVYEVKWDGIRVLLDITDDSLTVRSRTGRDITSAFPEIADLAGAHPDALLDAEAVSFENGIPTFSKIVERVHVTSPRRARELATLAPVTLFAFDVLRLYGVDLTGRSWSERRETLERLEPPARTSGDEPAWRLSPTYDDGAALLEGTRQQGLEGIVAKRRPSRYTPGRRSPDWVKVAHRASVTCVVGGWRPETGTRRRVGALLVGLPGPDGLRFLGRVGAGISAVVEADLRFRLGALEIESSPFAEQLPREDADTARWVRPTLWVEVGYLGHELPGQGARLRAPVLRGVRPPEDLDESVTTAELPLELPEPQPAPAAEPAPGPGRPATPTPEPTGE